MKSSGSMKEGSNVRPGEKQSMGVVITIVKVTGLAIQNDQIYVEIRNESNMSKHERQSFIRSKAVRTKMANASEATWNEDFFYNTQDTVDDNMTFILRHHNDEELGRGTIKNFSFLRSQSANAHNSSSHKDSRFNIDPSIALKRNEHQVANLFFRATFYEREELLGGLIFPNLSLVPTGGLNYKCNAIDNVKTEQYNCFSFCDSGITEGFNHLQLFPGKYKLVNDKPNR